MMSAAIFTQMSGSRVAIDPYDVCVVAETGTGTQITYMILDTPDVIVTSTTFDDVLRILADARRRANPNNGDGWKHGYTDDCNE